MNVFTLPIGACWTTVYARGRARYGTASCVRLRDSQITHPHRKSLFVQGAVSELTRSFLPTPIGCRRISGRRCGRSLPRWPSRCDRSRSGQASYSVCLRHHQADPPGSIPKPRGCRSISGRQCARPGRYGNPVVPSPRDLNRRVAAGIGAVPELTIAVVPHVHRVPLDFRATV